MKYPENTIILQGESSDLDFKYAGFDVMSNDKIDYLRKNLRDNKEDIKILHDLFINNPNEIAILMLKPPREFMKFDFKLFKNVNLVGYMSFNLRCLFKLYSPNIIQEWLHSFKTVIYYETFFAVGEQNTIDSTTIKLPEFIINTIKFWNKHVVETFTNQKILDSIKKYPLQFVNADTGLIAYLTTNDEKSQIRGTVSFDTGFSSYTPNPEGNILFICPTNKDEFRNNQMVILQNLLLNISSKL